MVITVIKYLICLCLLFLPNSLLACDSTILAILAGENINTTTVNKFLAVSNKLQAEGEMLNAYNLAAAKQLHKEIMENWLKLVSELGSAPMVPREHKEEFIAILSEVAKDLGKVRKKLQTDSLTAIHEIIENAVIKISILGAQINNKPQIYNFMKFELRVYKPGIYLDDSSVFLKEVALGDLENELSALSNKFSKTALKLADSFIETLAKHRQTIKDAEKNKINVDKIAISYNDLKNTYVAMKQQLLSDGYFK